MRLLLATTLTAIISLAAIVSAQEIKVPAFTAYLEPNVNAARVGREGITGWGTDDHILWGGIMGVGQVKAAVLVNLPPGETAKLKLNIAGREKEAGVSGANAPAVVDFGEFDVAAEGYQRIDLVGVSKSGKTFGDVLELSLAGPATKDAFFNLKPRRNAASVHLNYPLPKGAEVAWFYNEVTPRTGIRSHLCCRWRVALPADTLAYR